VQTDRNENGGSFQTGRVIALAGAHFVHDVFPAFLAPLLPLLIAKLELSLLEAGLLVVFTQLASFLNPLIGSMLDRGGFFRFLVIISPAVTGTSMCLIGITTHFSILAVLLLTCGIGVAILHVSAPVLVAGISGKTVGRGMSFFMAGGELARTLGPLLAVSAVSTFGLEGIWKLIPVSIAASLVLWWRIGRIRLDRQPDPPSNLFKVWKNMRRILLVLVGVMIPRALIAAALTTFLPTYIYTNGYSLWFANISLSFLEAAGVLGVFTSGTLSDRIGRRTVLLVAVCLSPLLMIGFVFAQGMFMWPLLAVLGFVTLSTTPVLMALTIENSGSNPATANGTYIMISFAIRALVVPLVGALGDVVGLRNAFIMCAFVATTGIPFVLMVPKTTGRK